MFHNIPQQVIDRMRYLENIDERDRKDGTPRMKRLRQIPAETGRFITLLAASAPEGKIIEIGTSAGYSALWLARTGKRIKTFEVLKEKVDMARETFDLARVGDAIELIEGDARDYIQHFENIAFCFLDAEKEIYADCYEAVIPRLVPGGILVADNAINHRETLQPMLDRALSDERVDALIVPIGKGELICRKIG